GPAPHGPAATWRGRPAGAGRSPRLGPALSRGATAVRTAPQTTPWHASVGWWAAVGSGRPRSAPDRAARGQRRRGHGLVRDAQAPGPGLLLPAGDLPDPSFAAGELSDRAAWAAPGRSGHHGQGGP